MHTLKCACCAMRNPFKNLGKKIKKAAKKVVRHSPGGELVHVLRKPVTKLGKTLGKQKTWNKIGHGLQRAGKGVGKFVSKGGILGMSGGLSGLAGNIIGPVPVWMKVSGVVLVGFFGVVMIKQLK